MDDITSPEPGATSPRTTEGVAIDMLPSSTLEFAHRMFDAAREGNIKLLIAAVDAGLPVNLANEKGNTLLMLASYANHVDLAKSLLARRADPNKLNDRGQSPLAGAVFKGYLDVVRVLVEAGADPRLGKPSAVEAAVMFGRNGMLSVLGIPEEEVQNLSQSVPIGPGAAVQTHKLAGKGLGDVK